MKKLLIVLLLMAGSFAINAQSDAERAVIAKVEAFNKAVFVDKDSIALNNLLASEITYGHSGGKLENRAEMIQGAITNKSVYETVKTEVGTILFDKKTVVVRHIISAQEKNAEGKILPLKLGVLQVWVKEKKDWKLKARQAVKLVVS